MSGTNVPAAAWYELYLYASHADGTAICSGVIFE